MPPLEVQRDVSARIPTSKGESTLIYYTNTGDDKEHLALVTGDISGSSDLLVRIHSECFTGDVLGSQRCDCGNQLNQAMERIASEGRGVVIYLRQEGRGIGLREKLRAYNLQDDGYDTVDANLRLGHQADERDYGLAALILKDLGVKAVRLLTNNQSKIDGLQSLGVDVLSRVPLQTQATPENLEYLTTKATRMGQMLDLNAAQHDATPLPHWSNGHRVKLDRPFVTLTYAQSLDGSIARTPGAPLVLSGPESREMTHLLRSNHDAILVGIGTVIADDPGLNVRLADGTDPQPIVLDSKLRFPVDANLLAGPGPSPWIATTPQASESRRQALEQVGARVITLPSTSQGAVLLPALLDWIRTQGMNAVMVEGGASVITSFIASRLVDHVVLTIAPTFVGGLNAIGDLESSGVARPNLVNIGYRRVGDDLVVWGDPDWPED